VKSALETRYADVVGRLTAAPPADPPRLLAVSKTQPAAAIAALADLGQTAFGENYVQEALGKQRELAGRPLEWHLIGPLQSNKCGEVAANFDWLHSLDRLKLVPLLAKARPEGRGPLNVLIQVNVDDEASKSGCRPEDVDALAAAVAAEPTLRLRGLMAIPTPHADTEARRPAFQRMKQLFDALRARRADVDTLSMGMSDDYAVAIGEGATLIRIGTALFGPRPSRGT
jgi:pyridoxal phosphate enzyme (YggS family)